MTQPLKSTTRSTTATTNNNSTTLKFLYSYGGKIIPRQTDGKLRYVGGYTRVLAVDRSVTFTELMVKFGESCGSSMNLKCKLPSEDLDLLVSIKSDEELRNVIHEYDRISPEAKITAVLSPVDSKKKFSPPVSPISCLDFPSNPKSKCGKSPSGVCYYLSPPRYAAAAHRCCSPVVGYPVVAGKYRCYESPRGFYYPAPHRNNSQ